MLLGDAMLFIYDRNVLDVAYTKNLLEKIQYSGYNSLTNGEKEDWENGLKGFLNYTDLNRIESNSQTISQLIGLAIDSPKTDWSMTDLPTQSDFKRIRDNVQKIRSSVHILPSTPVTPELPLNRYDKINDIEKILYHVYKILLPEVAEYYIDEIYIGEEIGDI